MRNLLGLLTVPAIAGCNSQQPSLNCTLTEQVLGSNNGRSGVQYVVKANAEASDLTVGVWNFSGRFTTSPDGGMEEPVRGGYFRYPSGDFDLVASTPTVRITVMPSNAILRERGLQGVIMRNGQTVSTGRPLAASCELQES